MDSTALPAQLTGGTAWLLVDAAAFDAGRTFVEGLPIGGLECLFTGDYAEECADEAPYIARVNWSHPMVRQRLEEVLIEEAAILVLPNGASEFDDRAVLRHFRRFLRVHGPDGEPLIFRFYDPRVLRTVIGTFDPEQLRSFLPASMALLYWSRKRGAYERVYADGGRLVIGVLPRQSQAA